MPQPIVSTVHVDRAITNAAIKYTNNSFIADKIAPIIPVTKDSDLFFKFSKGDFLRDDAQDDRAPGTRAPRGGYTLSTDTYKLKQIAFAHAIPDETQRMSDDPLKPFEDGADYCMQLAMTRQERRAVANYFATGIWGTDNTTATKWSNFSDGDPANDVATGKDTILQNTGAMANTLVIGWQVWQQLRQHPDGLDRFKHTQTGILTQEMVAAWLDVERIVIGSAVFNSAKEGQTASMSFIWGKHALLSYVSPAPSVRTPSAAYIFRQAGVVTNRWREEAEHQDVVECTINVDPRVTASDAGYFFSSIVV